tara:strand:- start:620 stop:988 length:369 start_codon:yes stop_codon:yes gene_type:complete
MSYLDAKEDFGYEKKLVRLSDIMISETESVLENEWAVFPRHIELAYSIGKEGLSKPVVLKPKGDKYEMTFGSNRLKVAVISGFTHIDAIAVQTDEEVKKLHDLMTQLLPHAGKSITHGGKHP